MQGKVRLGTAWVPKVSAGIIGILLWLAAPVALAEGVPRPWGLGLQPPGSEISGRIHDFHDLLLAIISAVVVLVLALLVVVSLRYRRSRHPEPGGPTHNLRLEILWTGVPCVIVLAIAWVAFPLLYDSDRMPPPDLTLKVTSHQWYWSYEYPDHDGVAFDSIPIWDASQPSDEQAAAAVKDASVHWLIDAPPQRLLEVDNRVVLPVGKVVRVQITGADVLHSWFVPSLGINRMAVAGRLNEVWVKIDRPGLYYGQCSMICGYGHGYMPIVIEGVEPGRFENWTKEREAAARSATRSLAALETAEIR